MDTLFYSNLKWLYFYFLGGISVVNNIIKLITCSFFSMILASSSFKCLDMHTFTYATPTFITEALCLVTQL